MIQVEELAATFPRAGVTGSLLSHMEREVSALLAPGDVPVRFVVSETTPESYRCELAVARGDGRRWSVADRGKLFAFRRRPYANEASFNAVFLVPTGIGAELGGHAGDAGAACRLLAQACDCLVTHPNVVNAADLNELPDNALYVEGSLISRFLMGSMALRMTRANRILVLVDPHPVRRYCDATVNMASAARAAAGYEVVEVVVLDEPLAMGSQYAASGRATGRIGALEQVFDVLEDRAGRYDAVAISSIVQVPPAFHRSYFDEAAGPMVNPWGGVEAVLTHAVSTHFDLPSAHAPMMSSTEVQNLELGVVDPRKAAEPVSMTYLFSVLKGLHRSPGVAPRPDHGSQPGLLCVDDVHCLVIPAGCLGLPVLAAMAQGIPVVAVRENRNIMKNDLAGLPFAAGGYLEVSNYLEAAGLLVALRAGVHLESLRRPLRPTLVRGRMG